MITQFLDQTKKKNNSLEHQLTTENHFNQSHASKHLAHEVKLIPLENQL
jgi:hypothetical protein